MTDVSHTTRVSDAYTVLAAHDLKELLRQHKGAIDVYMGARRQHAEAKRLHQDAVDHVAEVILDALVEMEQDPDYVPGKNAEARKLQAEAWLARHRGVAAARHQMKGARRVVDETALEADHARARVDHLELQIAARRTELDLIASFARGAA